MIWNLSRWVAWHCSSSAFSHSWASWCWRWLESSSSRSGRSRAVSASTEAHAGTGNRRAWDDVPSSGMMIAPAWLFNVTLCTASCWTLPCSWAAIVPTVTKQSTWANCNKRTATIVKTSIASMWKHCRKITPLEDKGEGRVLTTSFSRWTRWHCCMLSMECWDYWPHLNMVFLSSPLWALKKPIVLCKLIQVRTRETKMRKVIKWLPLLILTQ